MNLHPILVHFPVALLTVYSVLELIRWRKVTSQPYWFYTKALFVMFGGLGALAAYFTGDMSKEAVLKGFSPSNVENFRQVVSMHETFAKFSVAIFGIIAASYLILWVNREVNFLQNVKSWTIWKWLTALAHFFVETRFVILMALAGLICVTITGGLGGVMVYGPGVDPFFDPIYRLLFPGA